MTSNSQAEVGMKGRSPNLVSACLSYNHFPVLSPTQQDRFKRAAPLPVVMTQDAVSANNIASAFVAPISVAPGCKGQWQRMGSSQNHCSELVLLSFLNQSTVIAYVSITVPLCLLLLRENKIIIKKKDKQCKTIHFLTKEAKMSLSLLLCACIVIVISLMGLEILFVFILDMIHS